MSYANLDNVTIEAKFSESGNWLIIAKSDDAKVIFYVTAKNHEDAIRRANDVIRRDPYFFAQEEV